MRFEQLTLPPGATVVSASLTVVLISVESGQKVIGRYLKVPWVDTAGPNGAGVGWVRRDTGLPWAEPGARGAGSDVLAVAPFVYGSITGRWPADPHGAARCRGRPELD